ncbi:MAG TPA: hypothetical protein VMT11_10835 [Myxococcaceae bacterium]|nr:hypothetical protein [Myxococcaceae bacterium]
MNGHQGRAGWTGAWVVMLGWLASCNVAPEARDAAGSGTRATQVTAAVRAATARSTLTHDVVTMPNGERMQRISSPTAFSHVVIGRIDAGGRPSIACVDSAPAAEAFLVGAPGTGQ